MRGHFRPVDGTGQANCAAPAPWYALSVDKPRPRRYTPPRRDRVQLAVTELEVAAWKAAAGKLNMSLSDWMRRACNQAATGSPYPPRS